MGTCSVNLNYVFVENLVGGFLFKFRDFFRPIDLNSIECLM